MQRSVLPKNTKLKKVMLLSLAAFVAFAVYASLRPATADAVAWHWWRKSGHHRSAYHHQQPAPSQPTTPPTPTNPTPPSAPPGSPNTGKNCIAKPSACGFPDATNTGYQPTGVKLNKDGIVIKQGEYVITQAGAVIDGKEINGCVVVKAPNVTIKRSLLTDCQSYFNVRLYSGASNFTLEDTEINGKNVDGQNAAIVDDGDGPVTIRRMYMHNVSDGPHPGVNWLMEDSFITDLYTCGNCHNDAIQSAGAQNVTLRHNTIINNPEDVPGGKAGKNAVVRIATEQGPVDGFVVENNLLSGGNYAIQVRSQGNGAPKNVQILNNRIVDTWRFGPYDFTDIPAQNYVLSGNVRDDNGIALQYL
jgi:hypothetical protein